MLIEKLACWLMPKAKHAFLVPDLVKNILIILEVLVLEEPDDGLHILLGIFKFAVLVWQ